MQQTNTRRGFTLIELLVVVLIIAILAAVALPQYRLTIGKTRLMNLVATMNSIKEAEELYYLSNGTYTTNWKMLDLTLTDNCPYTNQCTTPQGQTFVLKLAGDTTPSAIVGTDLLLPDMSVTTTFDHSGLTGFDSKILCYSNIENTLADKICQSVSKTCTKNSPTTRRCQIK